MDNKQSTAYNTQYATSVNTKHTNNKQHTVNTTRQTTHNNHHE